MLENENTTDTIIHIIKNRNKLDENAVLDFKVKLHNFKNPPYEFIKDILSFLNSYQILNEDRYIIYGVEDKKHDLCPINEEAIKDLDDAKIQEHIDNWISPEPRIEVKKISAKLIDEKFGIDDYFVAIYIPCSNFGEVYELKKCMQVRKTRKDLSVRDCIFIKGAAFTRHGSRVVGLSDRERQIIRSASHQNQFNNSYSYIVAPKESLSKLFTFKWHEHNKNDVKIIESFVGHSYQTTKNHLKSSIAKDSNIFTYTNGVWEVVDIGSFVNTYFSTTTEQDLIDVKQLFINVLIDIDTKYSLDSDKRIMANVYKKSSLYSKQIKEGIVEFLNYIGNHADCFQMISNSSFIKNYVWDIVYQVMMSNNWKIFATLGTLLPSLAEASPDAYVKGVSYSLKNNKAIKDLFNEKEEFVSTIKYGQWLITGIEIIGRQKNTFADAFNLLCNLSKLSNYAKESIIRLLLPWKPQTFAKKDSRIGCGKVLAKDDVLWYLLLKLLPEIHTTTSYVWDTKYLKNTYSIGAVSADEFIEVSVSYAKDLLETIGENDRKIKAIIKSINCYLKLNLCDEFTEAFSNLFKKMNNKSKDWIEKRYMIWDLLQQQIILWTNERHPMNNIYKKFISKIDELISLYDPNDLVLETRRLFSHDIWELISKEDWRKEEEDLKKLRINALEKLYKEKGLDGLLKVCEYNIQIELVGILFAESSFSDEVFEDMINLIKNNSPCFKLTQGYLWKRYYDNNISVYEVDDIKYWTAESIVNYYTSFPTEKQFWNKAEKLLKGKSSKYWESARDVRENMNDADLKHYCDNMNSVGRWRESLLAIALMIHEGEKPSCDIMYETLIQISGNVDLSGGYEYDIQQCIKYLEENNYNDNKLFLLEWKTYSILDDEHDLFIHKEISRNSEAFLKIFRIYRGDFSYEKSEPSKEQKQTMSQHAFEILYHWKETPGINNGNFDFTMFNKWVDGVVSSIKDDYIKVFWQFLGKNLFYAPKDESGMFIDKDIAVYINDNDKLISSYTTEAFNSRGVFTVDDSGEADKKLAKKYDGWADELEKEGLAKFAAAIRDLAKRYWDSGDDHSEDN